MNPEHLHLLARWAHHQTDEYNAFVKRSQGLTQRQTQADLLLTMLEAIATHNAEINLRPSRPSFERQEWQSSDRWCICKRSDDPAIALLSAYVAWLESKAETDELNADWLEDEEVGRG